MKEQELSIETDIIFDHMGLINIGFASIDHEEFKKAAELIWLTSISNHRNNIYTIGNGASASIAQHWACDYTKGCKKGGLRPRVISLAANIPLMTAVANDISYDDVYSFQLDALGQEGDVLVAISSSGNSPTLSNPPTVSTATSITTSNLTGNWTAPANQGSVATTYAIELSLLSNDFSSPVATAASISSNLSSYQFTGLSIGTSYYYRVKAVNSAGSSAWSSVSAGATTLPGYISLTALGTAATEDFNTLASTGSSSALPNGWYLYAAPNGAKMVSKKKFDDFLSNEVFADLNKIGREDLYDLRQPIVKPNRDGYFKKGDNKGLWNFHYKSGQLYFTGRYRNQFVSTPFSRQV